MQFTTIATIAGSVLAGAGLAASAALVFLPRADPGAQVWFDYPVAARQVFTGDLTVTSHTDIADVTAISLRFTRDGRQVAVLTDTELETSGQGKGASLLRWASVPWNPPIGEYEVEASIYKGSVVVATRKSTLSVIGPFPQPQPPLQPGKPTPPTAEPTPTPTTSEPDEGSPTPDPSPTPSKTATPKPTKTAKPTPTPSPTKTSTKPTPKPTPTKTTIKPTPTPTKTTPTPTPTKTTATPTPEPPPPPLGGKVTRKQLDDYGWKNTFTVTGLRPGDAAVYVEVNLHNTEKTPYYNGWQSYPCGSMKLESGSGASATYSCTATFTIEPPGDWYSGNGEFKFWFEMPASVYRSKVVTSSKTVYGTGGNWTVARKQKS